MLKEERNGHLCKDEEFFKLCVFYFFILEQTVNEFDNQMDKKKFYLITICHIANLYLIEKSLLNYTKMARIVMANIELDFI